MSTTPTGLSGICCFAIGDTDKNGLVKQCLLSIARRRHTLSVSCPSIECQLLEVPRTSMQRKCKQCKHLAGRLSEIDCDSPGSTDDSIQLSSYSRVSGVYLLEEKLPETILQVENPEFVLREPSRTQRETALIRTFLPTLFLTISEPGGPHNALSRRTRITRSIHLQTV